MEATLEAALALPEEEWPKVIRGLRIRSTKEQIDRFNNLRDFRDKVAAQIGLDASIVAPKAALEAVAADPSTPILLPWQRNLLGLKPVAEPAPSAQPSLL
jgi:ribonuclease D